jgi:hypothetical protein
VLQVVLPGYLSLLLLPALHLLQTHSAARHSLLLPCVNTPAAVAVLAAAVAVLPAAAVPLQVLRLHLLPAVTLHPALSCQHSS